MDSSLSKILNITLCKVVDLQRTMVGSGLAMDIPAVRSIVPAAGTMLLSLQERF